LLYALVSIVIVTLHTSGAKRRKTFCRATSTCFSSTSTSTVSRFGEHFHDCHYSLVSCLFAVLLLTVPRPCVQPFVKVGARAM